MQQIVPNGIQPHFTSKKVWNPPSRAFPILHTLYSCITRSDGRCGGVVFHTRALRSFLWSEAFWEEPFLCECEGERPKILILWFDKEIYIKCCPSLIRTVTCLGVSLFCVWRSWVDFNLSPAFWNGGVLHWWSPLSHCVICQVSVSLSFPFKIIKVSTPVHRLVNILIPS